MTALRLLRPGDRATVRRMDMEGAARRRLLELGLIAGTPVTCVSRSPGGGIAAYRIRGALIALRDQDAGDIWVEPV